MDAAQHVQTIVQNRRRILLLALLLAAVVFANDMRKPKQYSASAQLMVVSGRESVSLTNTGDTNFLAQTYVTLAGSIPVMGDAWKRYGFSRDSFDRVINRLSIGQDGQTAFLTVTATGTSPLDAVDLARAESEALVEAVRGQQANLAYAELVGLQLNIDNLNKELNALRPADPQAATVQADIGTATQALYTRLAQPKNRVDYASPPMVSSTPVAPRPFFDALIAFGIGLVLIAEGTVLLRRISDRFSATESTADVTTLAGLQVLARIPEGTGADTVEAFRVLRTNLMFLEGSGKPRTLAVVSANQGAGKTFVAVQLAQAVAAIDERVVLVDADLRQPTVHDCLGVPRAPGLSAVLQGADLNTVLRRNDSSPFLRILPSGAPVDDPSGVLGARAFRQVLEGLRAVRLVVVDTPPGEPYADAMAVASQCDGTIFVVDIKSSRKRAVRATIESLERGGANVVGVVVNRASSNRASAYYGA